MEDPQGSPGKRPRQLDRWPDHCGALRPVKPPSKRGGEHWGLTCSLRQGGANEHLNDQRTSKRKIGDTCVVLRHTCSYYHDD